MDAMIKYLDLKRINDLYDAEIRGAISGVLDSGWYLKGEATRRFEQAYADYIGTKYCIGCGNGLDALMLSLKAFGIGEGDEVIIPANTFIATALAVTYTGAKRCRASRLRIQLIGLRQQPKGALQHGGQDRHPCLTLCRHQEEQRAIGAFLQQALRDSRNGLALLHRLWPRRASRHVLLLRHGETGARGDHSDLQLRQLQARFHLCG